MIETKLNSKGSAEKLLGELKKEKNNLIASKKILNKNDNHQYPIINIPFKIPSNWVWCYLSDISIIQEGPGIRKHQYSTTGIQFLTVTNILEGSVDLDKSKKFISKEQYVNYSHFTINKGDIVTACSGGSWGKSAIYYLDNKLILNTSTLRLRFYNDLGDNYYLYYLTKMNYFRNILNSYITGQQPNYGYSHYSKIPIPLPPLMEQKRIVSIIDEVFAAVDKAKANAEQNLKNAKELFESYLQEVFSQKHGLKGLKDSTDNAGYKKSLTSEQTGKIRYSDNEVWEEKMLGEVCAYDKISNKRGDLLYIGLEDIQSNTGIFIGPNEPRSVKSLTFYFNDKHVLYGRLRPYLNKVFLPNFEGHCSTEIFPIKPKENVLDRGFLFQWLIATETMKKINSTWTGATLPRANMNAVLEFKIHLPSLKTQQAIVKKLDALSTETKKLEYIYKQKIIELEEVKKSVLQKAFSGEL